MKKPTGLIIILHSGLRQISQPEAIAALDPEHKDVPYVFTELDEFLPLQGAEHIHWPTFAAKQSDWFNKVLQPEIQKHPDYRLVYFGLTHIPLAVQLGHLIGDAYRVDVYQQDYSKKSWEWLDPKGETSSLDYVIEGVPQERVGGETEAVIRFGTYISIDPEDTRDLVKNAAKEVDVRLAQDDWDAFCNRALVEEAAMHFSTSMKSLTSHMPGLQKVHLFAAVPTGLALLIGQKIRPSMDPAVAVYHFKQSEEPKYRLALTIGEEPDLGIIISEEDLPKIQALREELASHFQESVRPFAEKLELNGDWLPRALTETETAYFAQAAWAGLHPLSKTPLIQTEIALEELHDDPDRFFKGRSWYFSDGLLHTLQARLQEKDRIKRAIRLFMFHEALHFKTHHMGSDSARDIGRFPKVLETLDYQSDVYALLHEYAFTCAVKGKKAPEPHEIFSDCIDTMLDTMWAFDMQSPRDEMQVRRINRYMIWYLIQLQISHTECQSLDDILRILYIKPEIELKGLSIVTDGNGRVLARLTRVDASKLAIAVVRDHRLHRFGHSSGELDLAVLVQSFHDRDSQGIKASIASLIDKISD